MPNITIQPTARTVGDVLSGLDYYRIPRFQRPFSWEAEHIDDFWTDAVANMDSAYFIGPMVVYKENARDLGIVDGQQRLTIITLLLSAIRDEFDALGDTQLADGTHRFIERPDPDNKPRFVLQSDVGEGRWIHEMQLRRPAGQALRKSDFDASAWAAYSIISERLAERLTAAGSRFKTAAKVRSARIEELRRLRDQIIGLRVIWVPLDSEDDAYEIFETLNARGKDLEVSDRLKNHFLSHLRAANANVDAYRRRWNAIRESYVGEPSSRDLDRFIHHWWLSRSPYVAERKVFKEIRRAVPRAKAAGTFDEFEADSARYRQIVSPDSHTWTVERMALRDSLRALQMMRLAQPMPFVLALFRAYDNKEVSIKQVRECLWAIERFHFQVTAISTRSSSGGVSEMYASHARQLASASTSSERKKQLDGLVVKLKARVPPRDEFVEAFVSRLAFAEEQPRDKKLVQYVLSKLHLAYKAAPVPDFSKFTIEHLRPQSEIASPQDLAEISSIGNLLFVDGVLNGKLDSKDFAAKKKVLSACQADYDLVDVVSEASWDSGAIDRRGRRLAELAYDRVWSF